MRFSRMFSVACLGLGTLFGGPQAFAQDIGNCDILNPPGNQGNELGPSAGANFSLALALVDPVLITANWVNATTLVVTVDSAPVINVPTSAGTGSSTFAIATGGAHTLGVNVGALPPGGSLTFTCALGTLTPVPGPTPAAEQEQAAATAKILVDSIAVARPDSNPATLPGSGEPQGIEGEYRTALNEARETLRSVTEFRNLVIAYLEQDSKRIKAENVTPEEKAELEAAAWSKQKALELIAKQIQTLLSDIEALEKLDRENPSSTDLFLNEGESILYYPDRRVADAHVPWPIEALGYDENRSVTNISHATERAFFLGGTPVKLWVRGKGNLLSGTADRSGVAGSVQTGAVFGVTSKFDMGFYLNVLGGTVTSDALNTTLDGIAAGGGIYALFNAGRVQLGLSAGHEWGGFDINTGGVTGNFTSSVWTADASATLPFDLGTVTVTPVLSAAYRRTALSGYTDSSALVVPGTTDSTLAVAAGLNLARTFAIGGPRLRTVTPRASLKGNYYAIQATPQTPAAGLTVESDTFTLDTNFGVSLGFADGTALDLALGASNLLGATQSYDLHVRFRMPLN